MKDKILMTPAAIGALANGDIENFIAAATPGGIEAQEKAGQSSLCARMDDRLPIQGTKDPANRAKFEKMGFKFADTPEDDLFISASFPPGWTKRATSHSMWSHLCDDKGRVRAHIFFKAAFYDRAAHLNLVCRYSVNSYYGCTDNDLGNIVVLDGDKVIKDFGKRPKDYRAADLIRNKADAWLASEFPKYLDPTAYWD